MTIALALLSVFYAWVYARSEIDPDWAMFNLWGFTGAVYGRDFLDCKMPGIHLWYLAISKVVGRNVKRVRFTHHLLVSLPGVIVGGWAGLVYIVVVNSGALLAFHGNVGQPAAAALFMAMWLDQPIVSALLALAALAFESKLAPVSLLLSVCSGWGVPFLLAATLAGATGAGIKLLYPKVWGWLWEANITIPRRMTQMRVKMLKVKDLALFPWYTQHGAAYVAPWLVLSVAYRPDWVYWLPVAVYFVLIAMGVVVRPNHLIPLAPWLAWAGLPALVVVALAVADWLSSGLYLGDIWQRFYHGLRDANLEARKTGEYLRDKVGRVWVNSYHSAVYIYARKPPVYTLAEQIEIRENAPERREVWRRKFKGDAPEWVVQGPGPGWSFNGGGYEQVAAGREFTIFRKAAVRW